MSDEKALLAAIWEHPHEDTPRLMYADWLQETEDPLKVARAEFIRLQCARARLDEFDDAARIAQLKAREAELWKVHAKTWKTGLPSDLRNETFRRGFVYSRKRSFGGDKFLKLKPDAFDGAPQWDISLSKFSRLFDKVFSSPQLVRVDELYTDIDKCPHDPFEKWADNDRLRNVSDLYVANIEKKVSTSVAAFFDGPATVSLTKIGIWTLVPGVFQALAASRAARRLTGMQLTFADGSLPDEPLLSSFPRVRTLSTRTHHGDDPDKLVRLITAKSDTSLRELNLAYARITEAGAEMLAAWPGLANLRSLNLDDHKFGEAGLRTLLQSPHTGNLKFLQLNAWRLEKLPVLTAELVARFGSALHFRK